MNRRVLEFADAAVVINDLNQLRLKGYQKAGNWNLAQTSGHLSYFILGSLDGHAFKVPWLLKVLIGRLVLKRILTQRKMKAGVFTPQKPLPTPETDQNAAVERLKDLLQRMETHTSSWHASPFFGQLTPQQ